MKLTKEEQHAKQIVMPGQNIRITLDNDCYAFYLDETGGWDYDAHPDRLLRAILNELNVAFEEC